MKRTTLLLSSLLAVAVAGTGCSSMYVEGQLEEVCVTLPTQTIPIGAVTPGNYTYEQSLPFQMANYIPSFLLEGAPENRELLLTSLTLTVPPGQPLGANLDWITSVVLEVLPPTGSTLPVADLIDYTRPTSSLPVTRLQLVPTHANNIVQYFNGITSTIHVSGQASFSAGAPASELVQVEACFYARVKETLQDLINGK